MAFDNFLMISLIFAAAVIITLWKGIRIVPQAEKHVVERLGKLHTVLGPGLNLIIPYIDKVAHRVSILERQLPRMKQDCITADNVLLGAEIAVFFRVLTPERTVYRIRDINAAVTTTVSGIVRSELGKLDLDAVQSNRTKLNDELKEQLANATDDWGINVTRAEVLDVSLDNETRTVMLQQINADRARRATIAEAEGEKRSIELNADGALYAEKQNAEAVRIAADANAYAAKTIAAAIKSGGTQAVEYDIRKRQIEALVALAGKNGSQVFFLPSDFTTALGEAAKFFQGKK